jgi:hypothetical protein
MSKQTKTAPPPMNAPEQVKQQRLANEKFLIDMNAAREELLDQNLSREALIEMLAMAQVKLANAQATIEGRELLHSKLVWAYHDNGETTEKTRVQRIQAHKKNEPTNLAWNKIHSELKSNSDKYQKLKGMEAARMLANNQIFKVNKPTNAEEDGRKEKIPGSLTIKQVAARITKERKTGKW